MESKQESAEDIRLGKLSPFLTIMKLCMGPLLLNILSSFQDSIDLYIIRKGFGQKGVTIVSIV